MQLGKLEDVDISTSRLEELLEEGKKFFRPEQQEAVQAVENKLKGLRARETLIAQILQMMKTQKCHIAKHNTWSDEATAAEAQQTPANPPVPALGMESKSLEDLVEIAKSQQSNSPANLKKIEKMEKKVGKLHERQALSAAFGKMIGQSVQEETPYGLSKKGELSDFLAMFR